MLPTPAKRTSLRGRVDARDRHRRAARRPQRAVDRFDQIGAGSRPDVVCEMPAPRSRRRGCLDAVARAVGHQQRARRLRRSPIAQASPQTFSPGYGSTDGADLERRDRPAALLRRKRAMTRCPPGRE